MNATFNNLILIIISLSEKILFTSKLSAYPLNVESVILMFFEFSDYWLFHTADPNNDTQCLSPVAFGTTTGLLVAIIAALSVVVILQCVRKRNGNGKTTIMAYFSISVPFIQVKVL